MRFISLQKRDSSDTGMMRLRPSARVGYQISKKDPKEEHWAWKEGTKIILSPDEVKAMIAKVEDDNLAIDLEFNSNGVRRMASAFQSER